MSKLSERFVQELKIVGIMVLVLVVALATDHRTYAATGSLTMSPTSGSYTVGDNVTVTITENSGTDPTNEIDAMVDFSANLKFVSDTTTTPFTSNPEGTDSANGDTVLATRASLGQGNHYTGSQTVTVMTFQAQTAGTATVNFDGSNSDITSSVDQSNLLTNSSSNASFTINAAPSGGSTPPATGPGTGGTAPAAPPAGNKNKGSSINVNTGNGNGVTVPNGTTTQVSTPVNVQPTTVQTEGVKKIEYYLDSKLVATETKAPYTYHVDTTKLSDGAHTLVSKTYYTNGSTKSTTQNLFVTDGIKTSKTSPAWAIPPVVIVLLVVAAFLYTHFRRPRLLHAPANQDEPLIGGATPKAPQTTDVDILGNIHGHTPPAPSTVIQPDSQSSTGPADEKKA